MLLHNLATCASRQHVESNITPKFLGGSSLGEIDWSPTLIDISDICPSDNSSTVHARITKFGPEKQNTLVKIPIVFWGNWPWPPKSNLTSNSKLTPFWACPNHYSPPILVRISELGQEMHLSTVKIPVNSGLDWPWTSPSFLIPKLIFLHYGGVHWDCEIVSGLFQFCSGTVSQSLHQCTWGTHSQSGMGPLVLECLIWIKKNSSPRLFHSMTVSQYDHVVPYTDLGGRGYLGV